MKYYLGSITENCCGFEFTSQFLFNSTDELLESLVEKIEKDFRPDCEGEIHQEEMTYEEISLSDFNVLGKFLAVL